jgi:hypothetical protein
VREQPDARLKEDPMKSMVVTTMVAAWLAIGCGASPESSSAVSSTAASDDGVLVDSVADGSGKEDSPNGSTPRLVIPLLVVESSKALADYNEDLKALGMKTFPKYVAVTGDETGVQAWQRWRDYAEKDVNAALGTEIEMQSFGNLDSFVGEYKGQHLEICYRGDATQIDSVILALTDIAFETQLQLVGWRYKSEKWVNSDWGDESYLPSEWNDWGEGHGESIQFFYTIDDDGSDVEQYTLRRCYSK